MHGTKTSNFGISECDLLIVAGARFSDRVTGNASKFAKNAKILQIDVDPAEINKNIHTHASIIGDLKVVLRKLNARLDPMNHEDWLQHVEMMKDMYPLRYAKTQLTGPFIVETIDELTKGDAIICTEVGQHQMWAAQYYKYRKPRTLLTSGGLGTMGYGLGASIGAKMACGDMGHPESPPPALSFRKCPFSPTAAAPASASVPACRKCRADMCRKLCRLHKHSRPFCRLSAWQKAVLNDAVDFVKLAEAMGAKAYRVTRQEDLKPVLEEAIALQAPVLIECQINCDDKVYPMVSPGAPIQDAFDDTDLKIK